MGENVPFLLENETIVKIAKKHNKTPGTFQLEFSTKEIEKILDSSIRSTSLPAMGHSKELGSFGKKCHM